MVNVNGLVWHTDKQFQNHRRPWVYGEVYPIISLIDRLPAFQLSKTKTGLNVTELVLINLADENTEVDILLDAQAAGLTLYQTDLYDVVSYPDTVPLLLDNPQPGLYYLRMTDNVTVWYSEVFQFCLSVDDYIRIEYWHRENFCYPGGEFVYQSPFRSRLYIKSDIGKPSYEYEETVQKNNGINFPIQQISYKRYRFKGLFTEPFIDALRLVGLHDDVVIYSRGRTYEVNEFLMNDPEWLERGDVANVDVEFRTDTVVSISGRAVDTQPYEPEAGSCLVSQFEVIGTVQLNSDDYDNFVVRNAQGLPYSLQDGDLILARLSNFYVLREYNSGAYSGVTHNAEDIAYSQFQDIYFVSGGTTFFEPKVTSYDPDTDVLGGRFLPGAIHNIYAVVGTSRNLIGSYTYDELENDTPIVIPDYAERIGMELLSAACGVFQNAPDYIIPEPSTTTYPDDYINDAVALSNSVLECELYRLSSVNDYDGISPNGRGLYIVNSGGCTTYDSEEDAAAGGVPIGGVYAASITNIYGLASAGGRLAMVRTDGGSVDTFKGPFRSDSEALKFGVALYEPYLAAPDNVYGYPSAGGRTLLVRIDDYQNELQ